jgi:hypothetical protein
MSTTEPVPEGARPKGAGLKEKLASVSGALLAVAGAAPT